jgi:hypothetical protein
MSRRHNGSTLPMIGHSTTNALPGVSIPHGDILIQLMTNRNAKSFLIHPIHHLSESWTMRGMPFPNIKLPLMNHFMR